MSAEIAESAEGTEERKEISGFSALSALAFSRLGYNTSISEVYYREVVHSGRLHMQ